MLDAIEAIAAFDGPIAACFASPGGAQDIDLRIGWYIQVCAPCGETSWSTGPKLRSVNLILGVVPVFEAATQFQPVVVCS